MKFFDFKGYFRTVTDAEKNRIETKANSQNTEVTDNDYDFDQNHLNNLLGNMRYKEAAEYVRSFHMDDEKDRDFIESTAFNYEREGAILEARYRNAPAEDKENIQFSAALENKADMSEIAFGESKNSVAKEYINRLNNIVKDADAVCFTYQKRKRKFLGIDKLVADNDNDINNFFNMTGYNETELSQKGVIFHTRDDGSVTVIVPKNSEVFSELMYTAPLKANGKAGSNDTSLFGFGDKMTTVTYAKYNEEDERYDMFGTVIDNPRNADTRKSALMAFRRYTRRHNRRAKNYEDSLNQEVVGRSSVVGGPLFDDLENLRAQKDAGAITPTEFNSEYNRRFGYIENELFAAINGGQYDIYTNAVNDGKFFMKEDKMSTHLQKLNSSEYQYVLQWVSQNIKDLKFSAQECNGVIGARIDIPTAPLYPGSKKKDMAPHVTLWIPNLFTKQASAKLLHDGTAQASMLVEDMDTYGTTYNIKIGDDKSAELFCDRGQYYYKTENGDILDINKEDAKRLVYMNRQAQKATTELLHEFANVDGKIFDADGYITSAARLAAYQTNEIFERIYGIDVPFVDEEGNAISGEQALLNSNLSANYLFDQAFKYDVIYASEAYYYDEDAGHYINTFHYHNPTSVAKYRTLFDLFSRYMSTLYSYQETGNVLPSIQSLK